MTRNRRGYTLLELVLACSMVMIVLMGLYSTIGSMVNFQVEALRKSAVNSWTVASLGIMTKDIEDASTLYFPNSGHTTTTQILGCSNWSTIAGGPATGGVLEAGASVTEFYYCLDTTSGPLSPSGARINVLRRIARQGVGVTCPALGAAPASYTCTSATSLGGSTTNDVISTEVNFITEPAALGYMFSYNGNAAADAVNFNFLVGNPNPTGTAAPSGTPSNGRIINPQTMTVNTSIPIERSYMNTSD